MRVGCAPRRAATHRRQVFVCYTGPTMREAGHEAALREDSCKELLRAALAPRRREEGEVVPGFAIMGPLPFLLVVPGCAERPEAAAPGSCWVAGA